MSKDIRFYLDVLKSRSCVCEKRKMRGHAFCGSCYFRLPGDLQRPLWRKVRSGFEEAYEAAHTWLFSD